MKEKILFTVMDWGIGHATRSVPMIKKLQKNQEVIIASAGSAYHFLRAYFPESNVLLKPGYHIHYSKRIPAFLSVIAQSGNIVMTINNERRWIKKIVREYAPKAIYSDNCYGCYHQNINSIIITHQMMLQIPLKNKLADRITSTVMSRLLAPFDKILIPDEKPPANFSGQMSRTKQQDPRVEFIGIQSRFSELQNVRPIENDVCILLSGPEPQRTILEEKCLSKYKNTNQKVILVRGLPAEQNGLKTSSNITVLNHAEDEKLSAYLKGSKQIICRSGYSTLMDLHVMGLKALLIPTPGQTEQEYLAARLSREFGFTSISQQNFY